MSTRPSSLPAALDTLARRDLVVLAEERGIEVAAACGQLRTDARRANALPMVAQP